MHDLVAFIRARIADERADAERARGRSGWSGPWSVTADPEPGRMRVLAGATGLTGEPPILRGGGLSPSIAHHIVRQDPAATLARCDALTVLVDRCVGDRHHSMTYAWQNFNNGNPGTYQSSRAESQCPLAVDVLRDIGAIWASHPDYQAEWALA